MHDPMTVAFEIKYPWHDKSPGTLGLFKKGYRHTFITIWHVDPEKDGTDDSCGYSRPARWHVWHWHLQIHPLEAFKRWVFSRCATCGKGFKWGQSGWTNTWEPDGPQWFKSERDLHHDGCGGNGVAGGIGVVQNSEPWPTDSLKRT